jgi:hypothetical protein
MYDATLSRCRIHRWKRGQEDGEGSGSEFGLELGEVAAFGA